MKWPEMLAQFKEHGKTYTKSQLDDPDRVIKEIAKLGYSIVLRHETAERYLEKVREVGKLDPDSDFVQENADAFRDAGGLYSYRLYDGKLGYTEENGHGSPLSEDLYETLLSALFNIVRLESELEPP